MADRIIIPTRTNLSAVPISADINQGQSNENHLVTGSSGDTSPLTSSINELFALIQESTEPYDSDIKASGGTHTWTGSAPTFTVTITAATHGLALTNASDLSMTFYTDDGTSRVFALAAKVEVNNITKDITVTMPVDDDLYLHFRK